MWFAVKIERFEQKAASETRFDTHTASKKEKRTYVDRQSQYSVLQYNEAMREKLVGQSSGFASSV